MTMSRSRGIVVAQWGVVVAALVALELTARSGIVDRLTLVPIAEIWKGLNTGLRSGRFLPHLLWSGQLMSQAFLLAVLIGIPAGYALSRMPRVYRWIRPYIESYYCLPIFVFYPVAVAMMGQSRWPPLIIVWAWAVGGVVVNTVIGFARVPAALEKYCQSVHLSAWQKLFHMRLPAALPSIVTGVKLAVVYSISGTIGVEFILSTRGVGRMIAYAFDDFKTAEMYALILIVLALAAICHIALDRIETGLIKRRGYAVDHGAGASTEKLFLKKGEIGINRSHPLEIAIVPLLVLLIWYGLSSLVGTGKLASPVGAVQAFWGDLLDGTLFKVFGGTVRDTLVAFALSALAGLFLGVILGRFQIVRSIFSPWVTAAYTVPKIVLFPILLFLFGLGPTSRIAYGFLHAAPAIMIFTIAGMLAVNPGHLKYAGSLQLSEWKVFRQITLPTALPEILSGLRLGLGMCFLGVLVGEMLFGSSSGVGYSVISAALAADTSRLMAYVVCVFVLVLLANHYLALLRKS